MVVLLLMDKFIILVCWFLLNSTVDLVWIDPTVEPLRLETFDILQFFHQKSSFLPNNYERSLIVMGLELNPLVHLRH